MRYTVGFGPEAVEQLVALQHYLTQIAAPEIAAGYVERIVAHCESFSVFPHGGRSRDDIRPGLRVASYRKRTIIAFAVNDQTRTVNILGIFYGGQDYESALAPTNDD